MDQVNLIQTILDACVHENEVQDGDTVEDMLRKNNELVEKMGVYLETIQDQLSVMGFENFNEFFDYQMLSQDARLE